MISQRTNVSAICCQLLNRRRGSRFKRSSSRSLCVDLNRSLIALFVAGSLIFVMGLLDDLKDISPLIKLGVQFLAAIIVLAGGIGIVEVSNPLNQELIRFDIWKIPVSFLSLEFNIIPLANLVTVLWIVAIMNAINLSDGLDGLAVGVSSVGMMTLIFIGLAGFVFVHYNAGCYLAWFIDWLSSIQSIPSQDISWRCGCIFYRLNVSRTTNLCKF